MSITTFPSMTDSLTTHQPPSSARFHENVQESPLFRRMTRNSESYQSDNIDESLIAGDPFMEEDNLHQIHSFTLPANSRSNYTDCHRSKQNSTSSSSSINEQPSSHNNGPTTLTNPMIVSCYENIPHHHLQEASSSTKYYGNNVYDDEHVYANLSEITSIDRAPEPPMPNKQTVPVRVLPTGWREFKTLGGRSYFYHPVMQVCQWKPPRAMSSSTSTFNHLASTKISPSTSMLSSSIAQNSSMDSDIFHEDRRRPLIEHPELSESGEYFSHPNADLRLKRSETPHNDSQHQKRNDVVEVMVKSTDSGIVSGSNMQSTPFVKGTPPKHTPSFQGISNDGHVKLTLEKLKSIDFANPPTLDFNHPQSPVSALTSRKGPIEKCKMTQSGLKNKKFEWLKCYMVLSKGHLLFYKDEKSAEKNGKHYDTPLGVCDLRNASIALVEKRKKQIIEIKDSETLTEYSIDSSDRYDILNWYSSLKQNVSSLPSPTGFPSPTGCSGHDASSALQRNSSFLASRNASLIAQQNSSIAGSPIMSKSSYSASKSSKRVKSSYNSKDSMALSMIENIPCVDTVQGETVPTKESIIERLLRFFRSRPTIESLREKGVYKFEPVFGSTLEIICKHEQATIPKFIRVITVTIEDKGLETDGLYRVSGNLSTVQKIRCKVDQDNYADVISEEDVHVLTGTLKLFFRELSEPLFPISMNKDFVSAIQSTTEAIRFSKIDELLSKLPTVNRDTLVHLLKHLQRVSNYSSKNRMQIHNLAIIFGPTLFGCDDRPVMAKGKNGKEIKAPIGLKKKVGKSSAPAPVQPNQNLAFKMIMYGQVLEFVFSKIDKFVIFKV